MSSAPTGGPIMTLRPKLAPENHSPIDYHQIVVSNIVALLMHRKAAAGASWLPMVGTCTRVPASINSLPQPDAMVKEHPPTGTAVSDDGLVLFEVLSRSNTKADQAWRCRVHASVAGCRHYVTVSLKSVEVDAYDRDRRWKGRSLTSLTKSLALPALGLSIPLADIHRWTPWAGADRAVRLGDPEVWRQAVAKLPRRS
jgi:hypothetical protein